MTIPGSACAAQLHRNIPPIAHNGVGASATEHQFLPRWSCYPAPGWTGTCNVPYYAAGMTDPPVQDHPGVANRYGRVMRPATLAILRRVFHQMNRGMVLLWRLGLGRLAGVWPRGFGRLMVIEHTGRRSGARYRTPVNCTIAGNDLYCIAAFGERTDWYRNLLVEPHTAVWLPDGRWEANATDVSDDPQRLELMRRVLLDSGFAAPLFGLHPRRLGDDDLAEVTATYRLVRIQPLRPYPTRVGPGDLSWIWLLVAVAVAFGLRHRTENTR